MVPQHVLYAGLSWSPAIQGILVVMIGATVLLGSIYLVVATNTGARLGLLITLAGLFGWLSILSLYWWVSPPGNGPRGTDPTWVMTEIVVNEANRAQGPAQTEPVNLLPSPDQLPTAAKVIGEHPELAEQLIAKPEDTSLSDIAGIDAVNKDGTKVNGPNILKQFYGLDTVAGETVTSSAGDKLNGWKVVTTSNAGDPASAVDAGLVAQGTFGAATEYKRLNAFEWNPDQQLADACPDAVANPEQKASLIPKDPLCRITFRIKHAFDLFHAPRYTVIQVQPVIAQETIPGQAPPVPKVDPAQPVMSIVLIRDEGNVRAKPAYFFVICFSMFIVFTLMLHYRDKTLQQNLEEAEAVRSGRSLATTGKK
jgi:hypothetical protein